MNAMHPRVYTRKAAQREFLHMVSRWGHVGRTYLTHRSGARIARAENFAREYAVPAKVYPDEWFDNALGNAAYVPPARRGILELLITSKLAGTARHARDPAQLRRALWDPDWCGIETSSLHTLLLVIREDQWIDLLADEGLPLRTAARLLRVFDIPRGELVYPINDCAFEPPAASAWRRSRPT